LLSRTALIVPGKISAHGKAPDIHKSNDLSDTAPAGEVEIVLRKGQQPLILKGQHTHGHVIGLVAGQQTALAFRNEDAVPRQFVSALFTRAEIHFTGQATGIFRKDAVGFRLSPGSTLTLQFMVPHTGFPKMYDLIWCTQDHDKQFDTEM